MEHVTIWKFREHLTLIFQVFVLLLFLTIWCYLTNLAYFLFLFKGVLEEAIDLCKFPPPPNAICRYEKCLGKVEIYFTDPDFKVSR